MKRTKKILWLLTIATIWLVLNGGLMWHLKLPAKPTIIFCWNYSVTTGLALATFWIRWSCENATKT